MSTSTTPTTEVTLDSTDIVVTSATVLDSESNTHCVDILPSQEVVAIKKEYSIVGDSFYAGVSSDVVPAWLETLLDNVVENAVNSGLTNYNTLIQDVRNAIDSIDIAANTYVEQINFSSSVDSIVGTHLATLNVTNDGKFATILDLDTVKVDADSALSLRASDLQAEFSADINSRITQVQLAYSSADQAFTNSIEALTTAFLDQESGLSGVATAVTGLQTYVGLDHTTYNPNGLGILSRLDLLEKQSDGVIETTTNTYDVMVGVTDPNVSITDDELILDALPFVQWTNMSGTVAPVMTDRDYMDYSLAVPAVSQTPVLEGTLYIFDDLGVNKYYKFNSSVWVLITEAEYLVLKESLRSAHTGDTYIQYEDVLGERTYIKSYKFIKTVPDITSVYATDAEGYGWAIIVDSGSQAALAAALEAIDLADSKRRVFVVEPFPPYDIGDLWINSTVVPKVLMVSTADVVDTGVFSVGDWVLADEYAKDFIDNIFTPDSTQLHRQLDGKIEYYFYESYSDIVGATDEASALDIVDDAWSTQELKDEANGNVVYFKDSENAFWYQAYLGVWIAIDNTDIYQALKNASNAQATADGKLSHLYAWGDMAGGTAPSDYTTEAEDEKFKLDAQGNFLDINDDITTVREDYVVIPAVPSTNISASNVVMWFTGGTLYKKGASWAAKTPVPTTSGDGAFIAEGDVLTVFDPVQEDDTVYTYINGSWVTASPLGIISKSKWFVDLRNSVTGVNGYVATSMNNVQTTSEAYANDKAIGVENKFSYDSSILLGGSYYKSGFGLNSSGIAQVNDGLTEGTAFDSEFWVNAERFVLKSPTYPGVSAVFKVTSTGVSLGFDNTGDYNTVDSYVRGDVVQFAGSSYIASQSVPPNTPVSNTNYWNLLAQGGDAAVTDYWFIRKEGIPLDPGGADVWVTSVLNVATGAGKLWAITALTNDGVVTYSDKRELVDELVREILVYSVSTPIANSLTAPSSSTYNFSVSTGNLTIGDVNWSQGIPLVLHNNNKILVCTALVVGNRSETDAPVVWSTPSVYSQRVDGIDGASVTGGTGNRGSAAISASSSYVQSDPGLMLQVDLNTAWGNATSEATQEGDTLILTNTSPTVGWTHIFQYVSGAWSASGVFNVNGNQVIEGTLSGKAIASNTTITAGINSTEIAGMNGDDTGIQAGYRFWAGDTLASNAPFSVDKNGRIVATSGNIGGAIISNGLLQVDTLQIAGEAISAAQEFVQNPYSVTTASGAQVRVTPVYLSNTNVSYVLCNLTVAAVRTTGGPGGDTIVITAKVLDGSGVVLTTKTFTVGNGIDVGGYQFIPFQFKVNSSNGVSIEIVASTPNESFNVQFWGTVSSAKR